MSERVNDQIQTTDDRSLLRMTRSQRARWAVPAAVAVAVTGAFVAPPLIATASNAGLPDVTAEELLSAALAAEPEPLSGTVVYTARLGLPEIPFAEMGGADPIALLGGSSTLRVWSDGTERSRVSLLGAASEYSVVRDGTDAWTYSSSDDEVVHYGLSDQDEAQAEAMKAQMGSEPAPEVMGDLPTPDEAATYALERAREFANVSVDGQTTIAGRGAYQLVVTPKSTGTLVARIVVAVDAETSNPLRVQVWSTQDAAVPALEIGFTDVTFATPDPAVLEFSAPSGATVREVVIPLPDAPSAAELEGLSELEGMADLEGLKGMEGTHATPEGVTVTGTGWETVVEVAGLDVAQLLAGDPAALATVPGSERTIASESAQGLLDEFSHGDDADPGMSLDMTTLYDQLTTDVPEGRLLSSTLLSILVTDDGRVLVGAVPAETLRSMA